MKRTAATLLCLCACAGRSADPCAARMDVLVGMESARVHGLTENDDVREAIQRLGDAAACASPVQMPVVTTHARLLAHRLAVRGATAELLTLARSLGTLPLAENLRHQVAATAGSEQRLRTRARAVTSEGGSLRGALMAEAWAAEPRPPAPTGAFISHVSAQESCVVVVPGTDAPNGTVVFSIKRGGVDQALHGESPAVTWTSARRTPLRLCVAGPLQPGDTVQGASGGSVVVKLVLAPTGDDVARGAALDALDGLGGVAPECAAAKDLDARLACGWVRGVTP